MGFMLNSYMHGGTALPVDDPDYYRTAILIDATGQSNGTGYAADESRHAWALTYNGNAQITSAKFDFDGAGDYISVVHSILWTPGSSFTMQLFGLVLDAVNTGTAQVVAGQYNDDAGAIGWRIQESGGTLQFEWSTDGNSTTNTINIGTVGAANSYDAAICWDGTTVWAFLNGAKSADTESFSGNFFDNSVPLRFGAAFDAGVAALFMDGRFAAFNFTRGEVLYASNGNHAVPTLPLAMNTPSLTDSEWPNVIMLLGYSGTRIKDFGPYDLPIVVAGNAAGDTGATLADGTYSIAMDGSGDYLQFPDDPLFELGSSDFTFELFARHTVNTTLQTYLAKWTTNNDRSYALQYRGADATDIFRLDRSSNGTSAAASVPSAAWTPTTGVFYHIACCRNGSNHRNFVGGTQTGSTETTAVTLFNGVSALYIGAINSGGLSAYMNGYMSQVRITKAARYPSNFTAPTGALPIG